MKIVLLVAIGLFSVVASEMDPEEAKNMMRSISKDCKDKVNAKDSDIDTMLENKPPTTPEGKCVLACLFKQFSMMENGAFIEKGFKDMMAMGCTEKEDEDKCKMGEEIVKECINTKHEDECEMATMMNACMKQGADKRGITM